MRAGVLTFLAGLFMALCVWTAHYHAPRIEADLTRRVEAIVAPVPMLSPIIEGRDVTLIGRIPGRSDSNAMQEAVDCLVRSLDGLDGVRTVRAEIDIIETGVPRAVAGSNGDRGLTDITTGES